jgi:UDP-N-acetylglucosamine:LPS N-acetylglucosamine transferase
MPFRIVTVVTDLVSVHYSWIYAGVDLCLLPTDEAYELMRRRGMPTRLMARTGFPVHPKFANFTASQREARRDLNLRDDQFTILITSGGVGSGHLHYLVGALEQAFPHKQLLVVTGKNRAVYAELRNQRRSPHTHIYGFVQNMEALMAASDVVVTKAGPGTLMEALVMRRPVIVTEAVGRQETGNIDYVVNHNLGFFCPTTPRIIAAIDSLTEHEQYRTTVTNLMDAVPSNGSAQIAHILIEQLVEMGIDIDAPLRQPA